MDQHFAGENSAWTLERLKRAVENFSAQLQCSICLCPYDNSVSLPCNHCFCEECIHRALELKALCPICKAPANKRRLRYDTTVQELLRATEMLCAASSSKGKHVVNQTHHQDEKQVKNESTQHVIAAPATKIAITGDVAKATTPKTKAKLRLCTKRSSQNSPPIQSTLMEKRVGGITVHLINGLKIKQESLSTAIANSAKWRMLSRKFDGNVEATQKKLPALCEVSTSSNHNVSATNDTINKDNLVSWRQCSDTRKTDLHTVATDMPLDRNRQSLDLRTYILRQQRSITKAQTLDIVNTDEIQITQAAEQNDQKMISSRRRKFNLEKDETDHIVAETQSEIVEFMQHETSKRRRRSATDLNTDEKGTKGLILRRRRSNSDAIGVSNYKNEMRVNAAEVKSHTLAILNSRGVAKTEGIRCADSTNALTTLAKAKSALDRRQASCNGAAESAKHSSLLYSSQGQSLTRVAAFQLGDLVDVIERQWIGINRRDNRVPGSFIRRPADELVSDSTPSRAVKIRHRRQSLNPMTSSNLLTAKEKGLSHFVGEEGVKTKTKTNLIADSKQFGMVFLCSGFRGDRMQQIIKWAELLGAKIVNHWSNDVTHLIVKCVSGNDIEEDPLVDNSDSGISPQRQLNGKRKLFQDEMCGRWVKIRSLKYLKALIGGRWIVSDEWLQACAAHCGYISEENYEADGHWKGRQIPNAVKRSRMAREKLLQLSLPSMDRTNIGTMLFANYCFHLTGEFLSPMPPKSELHTLINMGGGRLIVSIDDIPQKMQKLENRSRKLIIVSDKINPIALRQQTKVLKTQPQLSSVSLLVIVNYLWVINSISEAKLRDFPQHERD
ncbi:Transcriptional regulator BRCA1 [Plasmopara halstedii]|uniref:Transcriptional regulator BRCA1 n=1 Tax=Plasmopara halstedii TaxID=4781 RepID=A0A0N7L5C6_PLAHL|nr:Transcriptional regulator BRCA1 [Plasmopara halstedii]CEG41099.1 Transcriptional regulator BRCA1 [Plasmopara halstedii]|eukprot:XP_024577468.1 Transcriptional regulator BRCA1 [Plasmopara halstedii]